LEEKEGSCSRLQRTTTRSTFKGTKVKGTRIRSLAITKRGNEARAKTGWFTGVFDMESKSQRSRDQKRKGGGGGGGKEEIMAGCYERSEDQNPNRRRGAKEIKTGVGA